jgi:hypothetical protein
VGSPRLLAGAVIAAFVVTACGDSMSSPTVSPSPLAAQPSPTPTAIATTLSPPVATATPVPLLEIADLPGAELTEIDATALCDPDASQADRAFGESTISCPDGLELALRVVRTATQDPVTRIYLRRPACASLPCSEDELSTAQVTAWTATDVIAVELDSRLQTVPQPSVASDATWPVAGNEPTPAVKRLSLKDAPREVARREPYPYCGRAEVGEPPSVTLCFRDAVLAGRPAEVIDRGYGTEGGEVLLITRFDGDGPLILYMHDQSVGGDGTIADRWLRYEGGMILGVTPSSWDFYGWSHAELKH